MDRTIPAAFRVPCVPAPAGVRPARRGRGPRRWPLPRRALAGCVALVGREAVDVRTSPAGLATTVGALARRNDRRLPGRRHGAGGSLDYRCRAKYNLTAGR